ncbi:ricin-type beta-trefoil lectin domain protein [Thalassomonas actiniarum]|uniref:Ricin-type beta-trefoil lectin domain protein n=1 Tax=Thalassomonas actiniarum TaxID=485447 RepID=A0AAE9YTE2_9GAMM|nr:ricin-type beta-trefoil lectin domain protein [Thalassomonas actiniarum]WDD99978.1 ricin-type beta-trefoil lectin domain protein [Thalassomonas actiniarum]
MKVQQLLYGSLLGAGLFLSANALAGEIYTPTYKQSEAISQDKRIDELYYLQPHNSYERLNSGDMLAHWLDEGFRSLELDVLDKGPWQSDDNGPYVTHDQSGKNNNCDSNGGSDRLGHCLADIKQWLDAHPVNEGQVTAPIMLYIDMKTEAINPLGSWHPSEIKLLDEYVSRELSGYLYTYQDLLAHLTPYTSNNDYRSALKNKGWPKLSALNPNNHRVIVLYTGGRVGNVNDLMEQANSDYVLNGFVCPDIDTADPEEFSGAIDSISAGNSKKIFCGNVKAGDHYQVTANRANEYKQLMHLWNTSGDFENKYYAYNFIAVAHGVSAIGIDVDQIAGGSSYFNESEIPYVGVRRSLPGYFQIKPKLNSGLCLEVKDGYKNGSAIRLDQCGNYGNQKFVYTAEGQLRPKYGNKYCVDFDTGSADNGDALHLWDCDGGNSEKWRIQKDGKIKNRDNGWSHCIDIQGSAATDDEEVRIWSCNDNDVSQQFILESVSDWQQTEF